MAGGVLVCVVGVDVFGCPVRDAVGRGWCAGRVDVAEAVGEQLCCRRWVSLESLPELWQVYREEAELLRRVVHYVGVWELCQLCNAGQCPEVGVGGVRKYVGRSMRPGGCGEQNGEPSEVVLLCRLGGVVLRSGWSAPVVGVHTGCVVGVPAPCL